MAISFVSAATQIQNSGTTITITKPAGVAAGDLMVAVLYIESASQPNITPPFGWISKGDNAGESSVSKAEVFTKVAGPSEPANYAFTSSLTIVRGSGAVAAYRAGGTITEGDSVFTALQDPGPIVASSVTTARPDAKLLAGFMTTALGTGVAGMTARVALDNGARDVAIFDQDIASPGATGTRTYTGSGAGFGYSFAIEEVGGNRIRMMI